MALFQNFKQLVANALIATPNKAGSQDFGPQGDGITIPQAGVPYLIKFVAQAGYTYTVGTDQLISNLIVLDPNGNPMGGGAGLSAPIFPISTFQFTPSHTGIYYAAVVGSPGMVLNHQVGHVLITAQQNNGTVPTDPSQLIGHQFNFQDLEKVIQTGNLIGNGGATTQYFLHHADGNGNGMSMGISNDATTDPTIPNTTPTSITPNETGNDGKPLTWVGATDAPGQPGSPTQISVAIATTNYPSDVPRENAQVAAPFTSSLPSTWQTLVQAAEDVWEGIANVKFVNVADPPDTGTHHPGSPDIRVGVSDLTKYLGQPSKGQLILGNTAWFDTANDKFEPDILLTVEDPNEHSVKPLGNGDYQYTGTDVTVFQDLLHEFGHALGLDHNQNDTSSIMYPLLSSKNPLPNQADITAIQGLYGAPKPGSVSLSQQEIATLDKLIPGLNLS